MKFSLSWSETYVCGSAAYSRPDVDMANYHVDMTYKNNLHIRTEIFQHKSSNAHAICLIRKGIVMVSTPN